MDFTESFRQLRFQEHVLHRGEIYIGVTEVRKHRPLWIFPIGASRVEFCDGAMFSDGLFKIIGEVLDNCGDAAARCKRVRHISVKMDPDSGEIEVWNDETDIPLGRLEDGSYFPEKCFGEEFSGTNFNDSVDARYHNGRNGIGVKATNIWSKRFEVDIVARVKTHWEKYTQVWTDNMANRGQPIVTRLPHKPVPAGNDLGAGVRVRFMPDYERFGSTSQESREVIAGLVRRVVFDMASSISVTFDFRYGGRCHDTWTLSGKRSKHMELYGEQAGISNSNLQLTGRVIGGTGDTSDVTIDLHVRRTAPEHWGFTGCSGRPTGLVNYLLTPDGGGHVDAVTDLIGECIKGILKKRKFGDLDEQQRKRATQLALRQFYSVVYARVPNPAFTTQAKTGLSTRIGGLAPVPKKGATMEKLLEGVGIDRILDHVADTVRREKAGKADKSVKVRRNESLWKKVEKLDDANFAGLSPADRKRRLGSLEEDTDITLILCEGDSAKACAVRMVSCMGVLSGNNGRGKPLSVRGKDLFGILPLRGKILNTFKLTAQSKKLIESRELSDIRTALGLELQKPGTTRKELRYTRVAIMTDQDHDGTHIKGLLFAFFFKYWPDLVRSGYVVSYETPLIRNEHRGKVQYFYTDAEYENWLKATPASAGGTGATDASVKYLKGLGTSTAVDAANYSRDLAQLTKRYDWPEAMSTEEMSKYFEVFFSDEAKNVVRRRTFLDSEFRKPPAASYSFNVPLETFITSEMATYAMASIIRAMPFSIDGFTPVCRKVTDTLIREWNVREEPPKNIKLMKLIPFCGEVMSKTHYKHGDASLANTIIGMGQTHPTAGNVNLISPEGMYGTRLANGKDHSSPRYLFTRPTAALWGLHSARDFPVLTRASEEGFDIEFEFIMPVVPTILLYNCSSLAYAWCSKIPPRAVGDVVAVIRSMLDGNAPPEVIKPWYRNFDGEIVERNGKTCSVGTFERIDPNTVHITEIPHSTPISDYNAFLENRDVSKVDGPKSAIMNHSTDSRADWTVAFQAGFLATLTDDAAVLDHLRLVKPIDENFHSLERTVSTCAVADETHVHSWALPAFLVHWTALRRQVYEQRKAHEVGQLQKDILDGELKLQFLEWVASDALDLRRLSSGEVLAAVVALAVGTELAGSWTGSQVDRMLRMSVRSFCTDETDRVKVSLQKYTLALATLEATTVRDMWVHDLDRLERLMPEECAAGHHQRAADAAAGARTGVKRTAADAGLGAGPSTSKIDVDEGPLI